MIFVPGVGEGTGEVAGSLRTPGRFRRPGRSPCTREPPSSSTREPGPPATRTITSAKVVGIGGGRLGGTAPDQNQDDGVSLSFTTAPLEEDLPIVGFAHARLELSADRPQAQVAARLCDIWPDGAATRITAGVLNLSHRNSHEHPDELEPGTHYQVDVEMKAIAYVCQRGHRLRLSISGGSWPLMWPSPESFMLSAHLGSNTVLELR